MLREILEEMMQTVQAAIRQEAKAQGHHLSGNLDESIEFEIIGDENSGNLLGRMYAADYSGYLEFGVSADRIPYTPGGRGKGGTSKYIQALISFFEQRGLSDREATGAAFATATVHAREGMPTSGSKQHSTTGERLGFIKTAVGKSNDELANIIEEKYGKVIEIRFAKTIHDFEYIKAA